MYDGRVVDAFERLRRLSREDAKLATDLGHKCGANVPETSHPPGAEVCHQTITCVAQMRYGEATKWWYCCEYHAEEIMRDMGRRV